MEYLHIYNIQKKMNFISWMNNTALKLVSDNHGCAQMEEWNEQKKWDEYLPWY
jgi:hypothetical protein